MSYVSIQYGQCGNQLGYELFKVVNNDICSSDTGVPVANNVKYSDIATAKWFNHKRPDKCTARAVLIDTEKKVIGNIMRQMKSNRTWEYDSENCIIESSSGAGNNWALGYKIKGPEVWNETVNAVRKECEQCDRLESILSFGSSAGGTGSGVGSYVTEKLHDEFANKPILNFLVLPYSAGEVVTQNFNTLFTISKLYDSCDAIFLFENDEIHRITSSQLQIDNVSFSHLNTVITEQLASVFQPIVNLNNITDKILSISAHSQYKLLSIKTSPFIASANIEFETTPKWVSLKRGIMNALKEPFHIPPTRNKKPLDVADAGRFSRSIGNIMFCRGLNAVDSVECGENNKADTNDLYPNWVPEKSRYVSFEENRKLLGKNKFATLVTNNSSSWRVIDNIVNKSWQTFVHKAYVHQYAKYGIENEDFLEMFFKAEKIVKSYKNL